TLVKALSGNLAVDEGEILFDGKPIEMSNPQVASALGIETVYQDLALAPHLDPVQNMYLGREIRRPGLAGALGFMKTKDMAVASRAAFDEYLGREIRRPGLAGALGFMKTKDMAVASRAAFDELGATVRSLTSPVGEMSGGQRQAIAIARAVHWAGRLVFLDEPTAALGVRQTKNVLETIRRVRDKGIAVVLISHSMPHVMDVCDRIQVLRLGTRVANIDAKQTSMEELVGLMTGAVTKDDQK
ncbi:ATP-binding cassette domain-containing protein, partial [Microbacterium sp. Leaf151]|uniref:ATP-binding cassette domain-containing protein n=1 Tax=Microbacterium sp. Leaf151 TaxID=1736276 RepID=UPI0012E37EFA